VQLAVFPALITIRQYSGDVVDNDAVGDPAHATFPWIGMIDRSLETSAA